MATYLVTGGCGFIGGHLVTCLIKNGHQVVVLDDLSTGRRENIPDEAKLIVGSICNDEIIRTAVTGIDGCFHLAAIASVETCRNDWVNSHSINITGFIKLLDAIRHAKREGHSPLRVVYASSAAVYGTEHEGSVSEGARLAPISFYGADKLACELHGRIASQSFQVRAIGLRLFNVYGPRQDPNSPYSGVISRFLRYSTNREPLPIYGDGKQTRDFIFVSDVVDAFLAAMTANVEIADVFNVCGGRETSINELAETICKIAGVPAVLDHKPARADDIKKSSGDPSKAERVLGFSAQVDLKRGLMETLHWHVNLMSSTKERF